MLQIFRHVKMLRNSFSSILNCSVFVYIFFNPVRCQLETNNVYCKMGAESDTIDLERNPYTVFARDEQTLSVTTDTREPSLIPKQTRRSTADNNTFRKNQILNTRRGNDGLICNTAIMDNFNAHNDTREPLQLGKPTARSTMANEIFLNPGKSEPLVARGVKRSLRIGYRKRRFTKTVRKGDILITKGGFGGIGMGHSALMVTDHWVLEMPGGPDFLFGIEDNNHKISKYDWFDSIHETTVVVYRTPYRSVARRAASWAYRHYYSYTGGSAKRNHIKFLITPDVWTLNPSYCSKLVIHAYYYSNNWKVINKSSMEKMKNIVPSSIPQYFNDKYALREVRTF